MTKKSNRKSKVEARSQLPKDLQVLVDRGSQYKLEPLFSGEDRTTRGGNSKQRVRERRHDGQIRNLRALYNRAKQDAEAFPDADADERENIRLSATINRVKADHFQNVLDGKA